MKKLLVLGAGQLARYLYLESHSLPVQVLTVGQAHDSAALVNPHHKNLGMKDISPLKALIEEVDLVTFESEFVHKDILLQLSAGSEKKFFPSVELISQLQDRKSQKELLLRSKVPTLPFIEPKTYNDLEKLLREVGPFVMKARFGGYDGYGTFIFKNAKDLSVAPQEHELQNFICEPLFDFKRELAVTLFRSASGNVGSFPLVEWKAKDKKCFWVKGPAKAKNSRKIIGQISKMLKKLNYVGTFSVEFFEDAKGNLLVNEVAPRVHNSCHYSLSSTSLSQFYIHLLCGLGLPTPKQVESFSKGFAMVNVIGSGKHSVEFPLNSENTWIFDYQKGENRAGRKLGHINSIGRSADEALDYSLKAERRCKK